jgi:hypothetical protein
MVQCVQKKLKLANAAKGAGILFTPPDKLLGPLHTGNFSRLDGAHCCTRHTAATK